MLATAWPSFFASTTQSAQPYLPARPSPLSPRSANACPRPRFWGRQNQHHTMGSPKSAGSASGSEDDTPFAKRDVKANPVLKKARQTPDEARERRREMFMKKVEQGREDRKWAGRTEQILRSDYIAQRRKWEEERNREAHLFDFEDFDQAEDVLVYRDEEADMQWPSTPRLRAQPDDAQEVDEMAQMEEDELRAMLALQEEEAAMQQDIPSSPTRYGSDDDDYDDIFMELLSSQQVHGSQTQVHAQEERHQDSEMMDMT